MAAAAQPPAAATACDPRALPLLSAAAVRSRCRLLFSAALAGRLSHVSVHLDRLEPTADFVIDTIRLNYPALDIPFHARWRHFAAGGVDRWAGLKPLLAGASTAERARAAFDLAVVSVLLDAGAGPGWSYAEAETGQSLARSEGLAVASLRLFAAGGFSADPADPLRCDAARLAALEERDLAEGFQVSDANPLQGLAGRTALMRRLGDAMLANPAFMTPHGPRPGGLYDRLVELSGGGEVPAPALLTLLLIHLGPVWPGRLALHGVPLGDTWPHPLARSGDAGDGLVPFHKLSQWLAYSLVEPLQGAGLPVSDIGRLTGLPEYRNGGLMLDMGLLALKDPQAAAVAHEVGSELVVEWRALTVALLDLVADRVRAKLGLTREDLPLARVLEGGTWAAGRRIAAERREGGGPPLEVVSDGTVF